MPSLAYWVAVKIVLLAGKGLAGEEVFPILIASEHPSLSAALFPQALFAYFA